MNDKNKNNIVYYTAVVLLIIGFNISVLLNVKAKTPLSITIIILITLLVIILFRNRIEDLGKNKLRTSTLAVVGIILTLANHQIAFIYAACGVIILMLIQFRVISRSGAFFIFGGKPLERLDLTERSMAISGLVIILSVALNFFTQILILMASA